MIRQGYIYPATPRLDSAGHRLILGYIVRIWYVINQSKDSSYFYIIYQQDALALKEYISGILSQYLALDSMRLQMTDESYLNVYYDNKLSFLNIRNRQATDNIRPRSIFFRFWRR